MYSFTQLVAHIASFVIARLVPSASEGTRQSNPQECPSTEIATPSARNDKEGGEVDKRSSKAFALRGAEFSF